MPDITPETSAPTLDVESVTQLLSTLRREISRSYVGSSSAFDTLLMAILAEGHILLEGVPGVAKTTLAKATATALGSSMRRIQFTPDLLPSDITGTYVLDPRDGSFSLRPGPIFANIVLADEINRAPAKTQSALLEAMQEGQVTIEGERRLLPKPFIVIATQNPADLEGTYPLPEAQLDRFMVRLLLGYPSANAEVAMLKTYGELAPEPKPVIDAKAVLHLRALTRRVHAEEEILNYAVEVCRATRKHPHVLLGASPRASLALLQAAKAHALMAARNYCIPDDISETAQRVLAHRLILIPELEGNDDEKTEVIRSALRGVPHTRGLP